jgi:hypothetical protein
MIIIKETLLSYFNEEKARQLPRLAQLYSPSWKHRHFQKSLTIADGALKFIVPQMNSRMTKIKQFYPPLASSSLGCRIVENPSN